MKDLNFIKSTWLDSQSKGLFLNKLAKINPIIEYESDDFLKIVLEYDNANQIGKYFSSTVFSIDIIIIIH